MTLDCIAGFLHAGEGRILLDHRILFDGASRVHLPPQSRHTGYVFRNYALFAHMSLRRNPELAVQGLPRIELGPL